MNTFVDTSGFMAVINAGDIYHTQAAQLWLWLLDRSADMFTTNYVVVETVSLLHHRHGTLAVRRFADDILGVVTVDWISPGEHTAALNTVITGGRRGPSLVDCTSWEIMRRRHIVTALAFDQHFADRGYKLPEI